MAFELSIQVESCDIDQLGHVNNVRYVHWVQKVAVAHWEAVADQEAQRNLLWVILRHEIDYKSPAFLGDILLARTWVGNASGLRFERHTEFLRPADRKLIVKARTLWCPVSPVTGRPTSVDARVRAAFSVPEHDALTDEE